MGQRLIISEEERKEILSKYLVEKVVSEQQKSLTDRVYGLIKNLPLVKKIEKSYDPDLKKHIVNLIKIVPKLKNKEQELLSNISDEKISSDDLAKKISSQVSNISNSKLNEQIGPGVVTPTGWIITIPVLIFLLIFIRQIIYNRNNPNANQKSKLGQQGGTNITLKDPIANKINQELQTFVGKTINLYDDVEETDLSATSKIIGINLYTPNWMAGDIQSIDLDLKIITKGVSFVSGVSHKIYCQYNPDKLENRVTVKKKDVGPSVGGGVGYEYNKKFTDALNQIAGKWCKRPEADFSVVGKPSSQNLV